MGPTVLFIHLKIILLQCFQFSVFSFSKNKLYPNGPLVFYTHKLKNHLFSRVFWLNIAESRVYLRYGHCSKLFRELRKESEFWQRRCQNSNKSIREKEKKWERENFEFRLSHYRNSCCPNMLTELV